MNQSAGETTQLQLWLVRHQAGDPSAKDEIVGRACDRLRLLAHRMLRGGYSRVARWEQTDDVLQTALIRLHRALAEVKPESLARFLGLAATQIRRTLLDLARHHYGPEGAAAKHETGGDRSGDWQPIQNVTSGDEPESLEEWTALHQAVEQLPEEEQQVFGLVWYDGLTQPEAAELLGVTERTVRRRWASARVLLHDYLQGRGALNGRGALERPADLQGPAPT